jgi:hypothetical protein
MFNVRDSIEFVEAISFPYYILFSNYYLIQSLFDGAPNLIFFFVSELGKM